ncbi:ribonuclease M5 [Anaerobranca gottschalkii]|uniref:Ribonuclease M5 n=1 Tax=Anaerobranca gottschalkii DSM 13577 TaxID=1120990 RepID=A0A1I0BEI0_9FIRM|nr:ribonuclease M5 [Anaerobranca gottschalkii]SET05265.1 ribonuclease M5 [Anaerobranca gottschalkii DSM 13577]
MEEIREIIVVEGKNDYHAVKRAFPQAEVIITSGFGLNDEIIERIKLAQQKRGVIVFTDPDHMGEIIRKKIQAKVPGVKHCYLPKKAAVHNGDIGIENADPRDIRDALNKVRTINEDNSIIFSIDDLIKNRLSQSPDAKERREKLGEILGIGYGNSKTFLKRLNAFGITREEFEQALKKME